MRDLIKIVCSSCGDENYHSDKNKKKTPAKLEFMKYCPRERKYTLHIEKK
jgi:large subunit ribosomal protein L33